MSMPSSRLEDASCNGRKKALLIAVRHVEGIDGSLPQAHHDVQELKNLLINQHGYAKDDIVVLMHDLKVSESLWPSRNHIISEIKWLVEGLREHDKLVFYYSGHGGQTICRHNTEVDGKDEVIYGYTGCKIIDNTLKQLLVNPVLKTKGSQLFALFDCCHSETILDLKHGSCCFHLSPPVKSSITFGHANGMDAIQIPLAPSEEYSLTFPVGISPQNKRILPKSPWSIVGHVKRTLGRFGKHIAKMLNGLFNSPLSPVDGHIQTASMKGKLSINTTPFSSPDSFMSPHRAVMSPIQFREGYCTCDITEEEENEGHVVCLSACRDDQLASDDNETGGTLTKFFMSSLKKGISHRDLLNDIQSKVTDLQTKKAQGQPRGVSWRRWRQPGVMSECGLSSIRRGGSPQEVRISSNRPFDLNSIISI